MIRRPLKACLCSLFLFPALISQAAASDLHPRWTSVSTGSLSIQWDLTAAATYQAAFAGAGDFAAPISSGPLFNLDAAAFSGLVPDTTYFFKVKFSSEADSGYSTASTATLAAPAEAIADPFSDVLDERVRFSWSASSNPAGTLYEAQISSDNFGAVWASSATRNTNVLFGFVSTPPALKPSTTYYLRVRAVNRNQEPTDYTAIQSTPTGAPLPGGAAAPFAAVNHRQLTFFWTAGNNLFGDSNPEGTLYEAQASTDPAFGVAVISSFTQLASITFKSLAANSTYYARVRALNIAGVPSSFAASRSTRTLAAPINLLPRVGFLSTGALRFDWLAVAGATYTAVLAGTSDFALPLSSTTQLAETKSFSSLQLNTTYYFEVKLSSNSDDAYAELSTATLAAAPAPASNPFSDVTQLQIGYGWTSGGNPAGSLYHAQISTDADFSPVQASSFTRNASAVFAGLIPESTYYLRVRCIGHGGTPTDFTAAVSTRTRAFVTDLSPKIVAGSTFSLRFQWEDISGASFQAVFDDSGDFSTPLSSAVVTSPAAEYGGLSANATYFFQVKIASEADKAYDALTAVTPVLQPENPSFSAGGVSTNRIDFAWTSSVNPGGSLYQTQMSRDGFLTVAVSSLTRGFSTSFGPSGEGGALQLNTTYYFRVRAINHAGSPSGFASVLSTATLAVPPGDAAPPITLNTGRSLSYQWTQSENPPGTLFEAVLSTDGVRPAFSALVAGTGATFGFSGLGPSLTANTTYTLSARAVNRSGVPTDFNTPVSTVTIPFPPLASADPTPVVSATEIAYAWRQNINSDGSLYEAQISTDNFLTLNFSSRTLNQSVQFQALAPDTAYFFRARTLGRDGTATQFGAALSTHTLPALPAPVSVSGVERGSVSLQWGKNGNTDATEYLVSISTAQDFSVESASTTAVSLAATLGGLLANSTYYARVRARSAATGQTSAASVEVSTVTLLAPPSAPFSVEAATGGAAASWSANGNHPDTLYLIELSTAAGFDPVWASTRTASPAAAFGGLIPGTAYFLRVRSQGRRGEFSPFLALSSTSTLPNPPLAGSPAFSGVSTNSLTASWNPNGNGGDTRYRLEASTSPDFNSPAIALEAVEGLSGNLTGLSGNATYYARVQALNSAGGRSQFTELGSTSTLPAVPILAPLSEVFASSVSVQWSENSNRPGTSYRVEASTFGGFDALSGAADTTASSHAFTGLEPITTYYFRAKALGNSSQTSAYSPVLSAMTLPNSPAEADPPAFSGVSTASVSARWSTNGNSALARYEAQISTGADFSKVFASSATDAPPAEFHALLPNTTYFVQARAFNPLSGQSSPFTFLGSTSTLAAPPSPSTPAFETVSGGYFTVVWGSGGNGPGTRYLVQTSTGDGFETIYDSALISATSHTPTGLLPNTLFFVRAAALGNNGRLSDFQLIGATITLPNEPLPESPPFLGVSTESFTVQWNGNGNDAETFYEAEISTAGDFSSARDSGAVAGLSLSFSGLLPNTTYYARARAGVPAGRRSAFAALGAVSTLAALVTSSPSPFAEVGGNSFLARWTDAENGPAISYLVQTSSEAGFGSIAAFARVSVASHTPSGLAPDTTYYVRVAAIGNSGDVSAFTVLGATATRLNAPLAAAPLFSEVSAASLSVDWTSNGNDASAFYLAQISTASDFSTVKASSQTLGLNAVFSELSPNTTYFLRVQAAVALPAPKSSLFQVLGSTATLAQTPAAPGLGAVTETSARALWAKGGNPGGTLYVAEASAGAGFSSLSASVSGIDLDSHTFTGLSPHTPYYFRVKAVNHNGISSAYAALGSTVTLPFGPAAVGFSTLSATAVTSAWTANGNAPGALRYLLEASTDNFLSVAAAGATLSTSAALSGLTPNTTYMFRVRSEDAASAQTSAYASLGSTVTLARAPVPGAASDIAADSIRANWSADGNPPGTIYILESSTASSFSAASSASTTDNFHDFRGLQGDTTYFFRIKAVNHAGVETAFAASDPVMTLAYAPVPSAYDAQLSSLTARWSATGNSATTLYEIFLSTRPDLTLVLFQSAGAVLEKAFTGLSVNQIYYAGVRSVNAAGTPGPIISLGAVSTLAERPLNLSTQNVQAAFLEITWQPGANPADTAYRVQASTLADFSRAHVSALVQDARARLTGLSIGTTYFVRVQALNREGIGTAFTSMDSFKTPDALTAETQERTVATYLLSSGQEIRLEIPPGALEYSAAITMTPAAFSTQISSTAVVGNLTPVGIAADIRAQGITETRKPVLLSMSYADSDVAGLRTGDLLIARYHGDKNVWVPLVSKNDPARRVVTAETSHFSIFQIFQAAPATSLSPARVFPNPFLPNRPGHNLITFDRLPPGARLRIYTLSGELVKELSANSSGMASWDGTNAWGRTAASGVYLALIEDGGSRKILKIAVER